MSYHINALTGPSILIFNGKQHILITLNTFYCETINNSAQ